MSSSLDHNTNYADKSSDGGSDVDSETSTVEYEHEPFETYQTRVRELVWALYGPEAGRVAEIARLPGGAFNRIVSITLLLDNHSKDLILRVPRFDDVKIAAQVSILRILRPFFPVPQVERYDSGIDNPLGGPYILMHRLPGRSLYDVLGELNTDERCDLAIQVAQLIGKIHSVVLPLGVGPLYGDIKGNLQVGHASYRPPWADDKRIADDSNHAEGAADGMPVPTTFSEFITTRLAKFSADAAQTGSQGFKVKLYDQLRDASKSLLPKFAVNGRIAFFHRDFAPRNILVDRVEGGSWAITGVLDWDDCEAAPYEIACVWPGWLWQSSSEAEEDFEENEWDLDMPVTNEDSERIKQVFVKKIEELEPGFQDTVRRTRDGFLRPLYERARGGIWSTENMDQVDRIVAVAQKLAKMGGANKVAGKMGPVKVGDYLELNRDREPLRAWDNCVY